MSWKLADAKNKFSEVVKLTLEDKPQFIQKRDEAVVLISEKAYKKLRGERLSLKDFLLQSSPSLDDVDLSRTKDPMREVTL